MDSAKDNTSPRFTHFYVGKLNFGPLLLLDRAVCNVIIFPRVAKSGGERKCQRGGGDRWG